MYQPSLPREKSLHPNSKVNGTKARIKNKIIVLSLFMWKNKYKDDTLAERPVLQAETFMELLGVRLRPTKFQVDDKFFQQKYGMAMGSSRVSHR
jgi:hypothetical protein